MNKAADDDRDMLLAVFQAQKAESLQHRQTFFNVFIGWSGMLLVAIGAVATVQSPSSLDGCVNRCVAVAVIVALSVLAVWFMLDQRRKAVEGINIARRVERIFPNLFEKGAYESEERTDSTEEEKVSILHKDLKKDMKSHLTRADKLQVGFILLLTVAFCLALWGRPDQEVPKPPSGFRIGLDAELRAS